MSLDDRDWCRAEMTRKRGVRAPRRLDLRLLALAAVMAAITAATPMVTTPRATYVATWQALAERMTGNCTAPA